MTEAGLIGKSPPRYILMAQRLVDEIVSGRYPVGTLLPTELTFCTQYGVSRHTVREALREVQALGLVARHQGLGTRVVSSTPSRGYTHTLGSVDDLLQFASKTRLIDVVAQELAADERIAKAGQFELGQKLLHLDALRVASDDANALPLAWTELYVIDAFAGIRDEVGVREGAVGALIEQKYGVQIAEIQQKIRASIIMEPLAARLKAPPDSPALLVERWYLSEDRRVFEYAVSINPQNRYSFSMTLSRN